MRGTRAVHVAILFAIPFAGMLSSAVLIPVLPKIAAALDIPFARTTWLITALSIAAGITVPIIGYLSDMWTRTVILAPSLVLYGLGGLIAGLAPIWLSDPFPVLVAARVLQGIGSAGTSVQAIALAGDIFEPKLRSQVLGMMETSNAGGKAIGPLIGAGLATIVWFAPFFLFPAMAVPIAIALWWALGTLPDKDHKTVSFSRYNREFWHAVKPKSVPLGLTFLVGFLGVNAILLLLTLLSRELAEAGVRGVARGWWVTVPEIAVATAAFITGRILKENLERRGNLITIIGLILLTLGFAGAASQPSVWYFTGTVVLAGLGSGIVLATMNALVPTSVPAEERGFVTAIYGAFRSLGVAVLPLFFVLRTAIGSEAAVFWILAGTAALTTIAVAFLLKPGQMLDKS